MRGITLNNPVVEKGVKIVRFLEFYQGDVDALGLRLRKGKPHRLYEESVEIDEIRRLVEKAGGIKSVESIPSAPAGLWG